MKNNYICKKCGCKTFEILPSGPHKKLICSHCNNYIAFVSSNNLELENDEYFEEGLEDELPWE